MDPGSQYSSLTALTDALAEDHPEPFHSMRRDALDILDQALAAVQPEPLLRDVVDEDGTIAIDGEAYPFGDGEDLHVLVAGKGSPGFAQVAREAWPEAEGLVVAGDEGGGGDWTWIVGDHPVPGEGSLEAGQAALSFARRVPEDGHLLVLLTGGASALMDVPEVPIEDLAGATRTMLAEGLSIDETNVIRRHLSNIKGGRLAQACPGQVVTLAISDVPENPEDLASGPTVHDPTTYGQALTAVRRVGEDNFPPTVVDHLEQGMRGEIDETPGPEDLHPPFHLLASNVDAIEAAEDMASELGYRAKVLPSQLEGEARMVGETLGRRLVSEGKPLLAGGETAVTLKPEHEGGPGKGGRNQELVLAAAPHLHEEPALVCAIGSDGVDGPTDAAGAIADGRTLKRAKEAGLDAERHLAENDSYPFFDELDDVVRTGPTGTNVMDLFVGLYTPDE
jgi:glycerate-2-kinase